MEQEIQFIKNLKEIPINESDIDKDLYVFVIKKVNQLIEEKKYRDSSILVLDYLENEIISIKKKNKDDIEKVILKMLIISEIPNINQEIRSLCIDIMLTLEEEVLNKDIDISLLSKISQAKHQI